MSRPAKMFARFDQMSICRPIAVGFFAFALCASLHAQPKKKRVLAVGASAGYQHDSVSYGLATIWKLGQQTGLWDTYIRTDTQLITKKRDLADNKKPKNNMKNLD